MHLFYCFFTHLLSFSHSNTLTQVLHICTISKCLSSPSHIFENCRTVPYFFFSSFCITLCEDSCFTSLDKDCVFQDTFLISFSRVQNFEDIFSLIFALLHLLTEVQHIENISWFIEFISLVNSNHNIIIGNYSLISKHVLFSLLM